MSAERLNWLPPDLYPIAMRVTRADECAYAMGELAARWSFDGPLDLLQTSCRPDTGTASLSECAPSGPSRLASRCCSVRL